MNVEERIEIVKREVEKADTERVEAIKRLDMDAARIAQSQFDHAISRLKRLRKKQEAQL